MSTSKSALEWAKTKLGCAYDQSRRMSTNPDVFDCSSLVCRAFKAVGYIMKSSTSTYEADDPGFDLVWPMERAGIGRRFGTLKEIKAAGWTPTLGDLIFYNQKATDRKNKITHVAFVLDSGHILHARNPLKGVCVDDIALYDGTICAVTRLKSVYEKAPEPAATAKLRNLKLTDPYMSGGDVRELQARLTEMDYNPGPVDGIFGPKTDVAVRTLQSAMGLKPDGIVGAKTRGALRAINR